MKKKNLFAALALSVAAVCIVGLAACTDNGDGGNNKEINPFPEVTTVTDQGPYTMTDANGTLWALYIEDNYDFILRGAKYDSDGKLLIKQIVGPTFNPEYGSDGTVTLGVAALTFTVDGVADAARQTRVNIGYQAFQAKWNEENDTAMCHIPVTINNETHTLGVTVTTFEDLAPGWGTEALPNAFPEVTNVTDQGPYTLVESNGTVWSFYIEDNYDFILRGVRYEGNKLVVKQIVGPTFSAEYGENGGITLGLGGTVTVMVDGVKDEARSEKCSEGYVAFRTQWKADHDTSNFPITLNNVTHALGCENATFEELIPGFGL